MMRWIVPLPVVALSACVGPKNTFVVDDPSNLVSSAVLKLCGSDTPLAREGKRLSLSRSLSCDGDGEIRLAYANGRLEHCLIGYVTPDAKQDFHFRAEPSSCQSVR